MKFDFGLYAVITEEFCNGRTALSVVKEVLEGGCKLIQYREKKLPKKQIYQSAVEIRRMTADYGATLIINDHLDIAILTGADGVHLGQDDLPCNVVRKMVPELIIGVSTHSQEDIDTAQKDGATYVNLGPVFPTGTKETPVKPLGPDYIKNAKVNIPFTVMGGIKLGNIRQVLENGARNIAMVTEITMAEDIKERVRILQSTINEYRQK